MKILPEAVKTFIRDECHDLKTNAPTRHTGEYEIFNYTVPTSQVLVIKGWVPYALQRTNIGVAGSESAEFLSNQEAGHFCIFEPYVNDASPHIIETKFNQFLLLSAADDDTRLTGRGLAYISNDPYKDIMDVLKGSEYQIVVKGGNTFKIIFRLLSAGNNFADYAIASGSKRIDFVGCSVIGWQMSETTYNHYQKGN